MEESILPTFYKHICASILAPIKSFTFTASTKKIRAKLSYEKASLKMLVKLTPGLNHFANILSLDFSYESFGQSFYVLKF
jgi:hypothetical protein